MANVIDSQFIIRDSDIQNSTVFDDLHQYTIKSGYKSTTFLNSPSTSTYSKSYYSIKPGDTYSLKVINVGYLRYNPDKYGAYCSGCSKKYGKNHGDSHDVDIYDLEYRDSSGRLIKSEHNVGRLGNPGTTKFECGNDNTIKAYGNAKTSDGKIIKREHKDYTCCKSQNDDSKWCYTYDFDSNYAIRDGVKKKISDWNIKFKNTLEWKLQKYNCKKTYKFGKQEESCQEALTVSSINESLAAAQPISSSTKSNVNYSYQFGNCLSSAEMDKIKSSVIYAKGSGTKLYSATFGELLSDIYIYDDRFFFILYKYYMTNKNMLCNVLESEILNYVFKHPELLAVYRIQKGYLQYALNNMKTLNAKQILNIVKFDSQDEDTKKEIHEIKDNVSCFMNIECPIIGMTRRS